MAITDQNRHCLPPNIERAWELLREDGPLSAAELSGRLLAANLVLPADRLAALPDRYPSHFRAPAGVEIEALVPHRQNRTKDAEPDQPDDTWLETPPLPALNFADVVVIGIETTGPDRDVDRIWEIAAVRLDQSESFRCRIAIDAEEGSALPPPGSNVRTLSLPDALRELERFVTGAEAIAGQNIAEFDLPFLSSAAKAAGVPWNVPTDVIDLLELSVLTLPGLPNRRLGDLCRALDIPGASPHRVSAEAETTGAAIRALIAGIDPDEPSWALATACLRAGKHPLSRLLPHPRQAPTLTEGLTPKDDPLCSSGDGRDWTSAREAGALGLKAIEGQPGYRTRQSQREMADLVGTVQDHGGGLAVEAPTGTGKSLAYLLPSAGRAASGRPVVVATATRVLQQQLREDALRLREAGLLTVPFRQLQGVSNYICTRAVAESLDDPAGDAAWWMALAVSIRGLAEVPTGTWSDVTDGGLQRRDPRYRLVRNTLRTDADGCERRECPWAHRCPLFKRLDGLDREPGILSVNHALVASWIARSGPTDDEGDRNRSLRSPTDVLTKGHADLVFDEAHDLEDTLTSAWTENLSEYGLASLAASLGARRGPLRMARRAFAALELDVDELASLSDLRDARKDLLSAGQELGEAVRVYVHEYGGSGAEVVLQRGIADRRPEFKAVRSAAVELRLALIAIRRSGLGLINDLQGLGDEENETPKPVAAALSRLFALLRHLETPLEVVDGLRELRDGHLWLHRLTVERGVDDSAGPWGYERVPIHIAHRFSRDVVQPAHSVVLTSATLQVAGSFTFLSQRLGIQIEAGAETQGAFDGRVLRSPFDYEKQSALVLTNHLPVPVPVSEREFCEEMAADQVGFLSLSKGKALVLFAARSRMNKVAELTRARAQQLEERDVRIVTQDEVSRVELAARFREEPGTVAYGVRSYWQGFDAKGETLTYLFIEKPPYPHPDDALVRARQRALEDIGQDPFLGYVVPKTAILMAQGFGRLIRDEDDRGVAIVCDRRLQSPGVANQMLLDTLPGPTIHHAENRADAWTFAIEFATGVPPDLSDAVALPLDDVSSLLAELRLVEGEDPEAKLRRAAREIFQVEHMRDEQMDLMRAFLDGRDALGVMPTGSGKSLCFQLPALLAPLDRATVVVSPLVALIKDQVDDLRGRRGLRPVQGITGRTTSAVRTEILRDVNEGRVRLLYVSPERLARDPTLTEALAAQQLQGLVVDEAHCVSVWGHDFRPEFRQIPKAVAGFKRTPRLALTATATPDVADDILEALDLDDPLVVRAPADRPNLRFWVVKCADDRSRARELLRIVLSMPDQPGIIYTSRRASSEEVAALLRAAHVSARHYHAGLVPEQREAIQDDFFSGNTRVIVATKAFGMGINKPDIGWVVHFDLPESLDSYAQEAGRAARDHQMAGECILLFTERDIARRRGHAERSTAQSSTALAGRLLDALGRCRTRGDSVVFDPETMADQLGAEEDEINLALAWLERAGVVDRKLDCSTRGMVSRGVRKPSDEQDRRRFTELFATTIRTTPEKASQVDFARLEDEKGIDPDALERDLVRWSLDRFVTFSSTRRSWRVRLTGKALDEKAYAERIEEFRVWGQERLQRMIEYGRHAGCRRVAINQNFGDEAHDCLTTPTARACDWCSGERAPWLALPDHEVPDPETIVNVDVVVLRAIAWASRYEGGRYGEVGLRAAVLGNEVLSKGQPIGAGLLNCPQFGALRYVRGKERRYDKAVAHLIGEGLVERSQSEHSSGRKYSSLTASEQGLDAIGAPHA